MNKYKHSVIFFTLKYICIFLAIIGSSSLFANDLYKIEPFIDFSLQAQKTTPWLAPIANTQKDNELFFANSNGEVYKAKGQKIEPLPLINFAQQLQTQVATFTAFTLHPNFHLFDQLGSNVVYTAHIEEYNPTIKNGRLNQKAIKDKQAYDSVIMEWHLSNINNNQVNVTSQREVLRIATTSINSHINQLSFNPYLKTWSDNFGFIYISLTPDEHIKESTLYSGSILRINPNKFGLSNYTVPHNNPFTKNPKIEDEIVILGAQKIQQFTWSKQSKNALILTHKYGNEDIISNSALGSNYLQQSPLNIIYTHKNKNSTLSTVYYKSRGLKNLWNKILFIEQTNKQWHLNSTSSVNTQKNIQTPNIEIDLSTMQFPSTHQLSLYIPRENELLLWDKSQAMIYKIFPNLLTQFDAPNQEQLKENTSSNRVFYLAFIIILVVIILLFIRKKYAQVFFKNKTILRANYARFEYNIKTNEVTLYKRHEANIEVNLSVNDIFSSEITLNDKLLNKVTIENNCHFDVQKENVLNMSFEQEHRDKMVDDKVRKITLKLTTIKADEYVIFAYLREGNQRLTKEKYQDAINTLIDWHWYFSSIIQPDNTPKRVLKPEIILLKKEKQNHLNTVKETNHLSDKKSEPKPIAETPETKNTIDTKLIDALNKLVMLKEQGHITEAEFELAKTNLLSRISN